MEALDNTLQQSTRSLLEGTASMDPMETQVASESSEREESTFSSSSMSYFSSRDFKELLGCLGLATVCGLLTLMGLEPNQRPLPVQLLDTGEYVLNLNFNEAFDGDTISNALLIVLAIAVPVVIQLALSKIWGRHGDTHASLCVYILALTLVLSVTGGIKVYVGYLRPVFFDLCEPDDEYQECTAEDGGGDNIRMSFPSGHASTSFCGMTLLSLYIHSRFGVASIRATKLENVADGLHQWTTVYTKHPARYRAISVLALVPLAVALFIATSRIVDNVS